QAKIDHKASSTISPDEDVAVIKFETPLALEDNFVFASVLGRQDFAKFEGVIPANTLGTVSINHVAEISNTDTKRIAFFDHVDWHRGLRGSGWFISKSTSRVEAADSGSPGFVQKDKTY